MRKAGTFFIIIGVIAVCAGLLLAGYNVVSDYIIGTAAQKTAVQLMNALYEAAAEETADGLNSSADSAEAGSPDLYPKPGIDYTMKTVEINGHSYIGVLYFPKTETMLPVFAEYNGKNLANGPCRFSGTIGEANLVICAHNTAHQFGKIQYYEENDEVWFIDAEDTQFKYTVCEKRTLESSQLSEMCGSDSDCSWDMTLFTCNNGGVTRLAVRCVLAEMYPKGLGPISLG